MTRRVVVLGAGPAGLATANRLASAAEASTGLQTGIEVVLVDSSPEHRYLAGLTAVLFEGADPATTRRPIVDLCHPGVRFVLGELKALDPEGPIARGSFGELAADRLVVALGVEVGWPDGTPPCGELAPWTPAGAVAGREALARIGPDSHVVVAPASLPYRCPPAIFDLAARLRLATGAEVTLAHPWPKPLAPFGEAVGAAVGQLLDGAGVVWRGDFALERVEPEALVGASGERVGFDVAFVVPPHRPPAPVAASALAGPDGWPRVEFPTLVHPEHPAVTVLGDLAAPALGVGMAATLAVFEAGYVADRITAELTGGPSPPGPRMAAVCFFDIGTTASFLYCDFGAPAAGLGPPACVFMPPMPWFRSAKRAFAAEWFASTVRGELR
jgi:sulfide:quinone oxidoreductase